MSGVVVFILRILMTAALYAFLGWALYTIWRDLKSQALLASSSRIPMIILTVNGEETLEPFRFQKQDILIGRDQTCDLSLKNETVSTHHARLTYRQNQWWLEDLNSTNGTYLNEERVLTTTVIISGDEVRCGQEDIKIEILPLN